MSAFRPNQPTKYGVISAFARTSAISRGAVYAALRRGELLITKDGVIVRADATPLTHEGGKRKGPFHGPPARTY